jgi:hypothetical protein
VEREHEITERSFDALTSPSVSIGKEGKIEESLNCFVDTLFVQFLTIFDSFREIAKMKLSQSGQ